MEVELDGVRDGGASPFVASLEGSIVGRDWERVWLGETLIRFDYRKSHRQVLRKERAMG